MGGWVEGDPVGDRAFLDLPAFRPERGGLIPSVRVAYETWGTLAADGSNNVVWLLGREGGALLGRFGRNGRNAGEFHWVHNMAVDSRGNVFTTEVDTGKRAQRFRLVTQLPR